MVSKNIDTFGNFHNYNCIIVYTSVRKDSLPASQKVMC